LNKIGGCFNAMDGKRLHAFSAQVAVTLKNAMTVSMFGLRTTTYKVNDLDAAK